MQRGKEEDELTIVLALFYGALFGAMFLIHFLQPEGQATMSSSKSATHAAESTE